METERARLKILIIQPWIRLGGAELISVHLAYQLQKRGMKAQIVCCFVSDEGMPSQAHSVQYLLPASWVSKLIMKSRVLFLLLSPIVLLILVWKHSQNSEVLNPHNFPASWIAAIVGKLRQIPVIWTCNEPPERLSLGDVRVVGFADYLGWLAASSILDRFLIRGVTKFHVLSNKTQREVMARYGRESEIIRSGVDSALFSGGDASGFRERYGLDGTFVLLMVGKLHPQKNQALGIEVLHKCLQRSINATLLIVGDGPMRTELETLTRELGLSNQIHFLGMVHSDELADAYSACDLNIFAASNQSWGLTPFEALASKTISIVSDETGAAEIVAEEEIGLVSSPTAEGFADLVTKVYQNRGKHDQMATRGYQYVARNLSHDAFGERFQRLAYEVAERNLHVQAEKAALAGTPKT